VKMLYIHGFFNNCFFLSIMFFLATFLEGFQIARIIYNKHKIKSFQMGFLLLCFVWGIFRGIMFLLNDVVSDTGFAIIFWIPYPIQFATFSLLVMYYAGLIHREWRSYWRKRYVVVYAVSNIFFLCVIIAIIVSEIRYANAPTTPNWLTNLTAIFGGVLFLILMIILTIYGWKAKSSNQLNLQPLIQKANSQTSLIIVTFILFILFCSRSFYDFFTVKSSLSLDSCDFSSANSIYVLLTFFAWEILPILLVLFLFWRIPPSQPRNAGFQQNYSQFGAAVNMARPTQPPNTNIFNNPMRYDSDEEEGADNTPLGLVQSSSLDPDQVIDAPATFFYAPYSTTSALLSINSDEK